MNIHPTPLAIALQDAEKQGRLTDVPNAIDTTPLRNVLARMSPGPWETRKRQRLGTLIENRPKNRPDHWRVVAEAYLESDATGMSELRNSANDLLDEIDRLTAENGRLRKASESDDALLAAHMAGFHERDEEIRKLTAEVARLREAYEMVRKAAMEIPGWEDEPHWGETLVLQADALVEGKP
jgi:hypothetical protein